MKIAIFDVIGKHAGMDYYEQAYVKMFEKKGCKAKVFSNFKETFSRQFFPNFFSKPKLLGILSFLWAYFKFLFFLIFNCYDRIIYMAYGETYEIPFLFLSSFSHKVYIDVHEVHALRIKDGTSLARFFEFFYKRCIRNVIYHSERTQQILSGAGINMIFVPHVKYAFQKTYNKKNLSLDVASCFTYNGRKRYLFFGSLSKAKGIDIVVNIFGKLANLGRQFELVIAGQNVDNIDFSSLNYPFIHVIPRHINDDEMIYLYSNTHYVLLPYRTTSQSGIFEMAAYFHKPMLLSETEYFKEMIHKFPSFGYLASLNQFETLVERSLAAVPVNFYTAPDCDRFEMKRDFKAFLEQMTMKNLRLKEYGSFKDKESSYLASLTIDNEQDLDKAINSLKTGNFIFRGINQAKYKMFSSSQRLYLTNDKVVELLGTMGYDDFVLGLIDKIKNCKEVTDYLTKHNIPINDMELLAILQHYTTASPLLDFSLEIEQALFFATDLASEPKSYDIGDYISVYYIDKNNPWIASSIQSVNVQGAARADAMLKEFKANNPNSKVITDGVEKEMEYLPYQKFSDFDVISLEGPKAGNVSVSIPNTGFKTNYHITNPRLQAQAGMFILNTTSDEPLVELLNRMVNFKIVNCLNIHKSLIKYINDKYLFPNNINRTTMYNSSKDDNYLEQVIKNLYGFK